jgi:hypothetical protein
LSAETKCKRKCLRPVRRTLAEGGHAGRAPHPDLSGAGPLGKVKGMHKNFRTIVFAVILLLPSCREKESSNPLANKPPDNILSDTVISISPDTVVIGSKIKLRVKLYDTTHIINTMVLSDSVYSFADSIDESSSYFTIPFMTKTCRPFLFLTSKNSIIIGPFGPRIVVAEDYDNMKINTVWYNIPGGISLKDTCQYNFDNLPMLWQCKIMSDTIILSMSNNPSGYVWVTKTLKFIDQGPNTLPRLFRFVINKIDDASQKSTNSISAGFIKIEKWDTNSYILGEFFYCTTWYGSGKYNKEPDNLVFYYRFK